jgi:hypothetical protein
MWFGLFPAMCGSACFPQCQCSYRFEAVRKGARQKAHGSAFALVSLADH